MSENNESNSTEDSFKKKVILGMLTTLSAGMRQPSLLVGTLTGEEHELSALLAAFNATALGVPCDYVGSQLPGAEFSRIAKQRNVSTVVLSFICDPPPPVAVAELATLRASLPASVQVWIGGGGAIKLADSKSGLVLLRSLADLRSRAKTLIR